MGPFGDLHMHFTRSPCVAALLLLLAIDSCRGSAKVVQLQVVHRHGDRTALKADDPNYLPNAHMKESWQKLTGVGTGQLTAVGMKQAESLGSYLRKTYITEGQTLLGT